MRNFVVKNDFNRASSHKDKKKDYSRTWDKDKELIDVDLEDFQPETEENQQCGQ